MSQTDHVRIDFTSDVSSVTRDWLLFPLRTINGIGGRFTVGSENEQLYSYEHIDRNTGQLVIEITAHDRETFDLTDGQVVERLRVTARQQGISVKELLRRLATE